MLSAGRPRLFQIGRRSGARHKTKSVGSQPTLGASMATALPLLPLIVRGGTVRGRQLAKVARTQYAPSEPFSP
jgi:hypothetical protein